MNKAEKYGRIVQIDADKTGKTMNRGSFVKKPVNVVLLNLLDRVRRDLNDNGPTVVYLFLSTTRTFTKNLKVPIVLIL